MTWVATTTSGSSSMMITVFFALAMGLLHCETFHSAGQKNERPEDRRILTARLPAVQRKTLVSAPGAGTLT
jgi:hypothetical protein